MKTLKYVALAILLLLMLGLGCQIGRNIMITKPTVAIMGKDANSPAAMVKEIDGFITKIDRKEPLDTAELKDLLVRVKGFLSECAKNGTVATETQTRLPVGQGAQK